MFITMTEPDDSASVASTGFIGNLLAWVRRINGLVGTQGSH